MKFARSYPALLTRRSIRPNVSMVRPTAWSTWRASPTSQATARARRPSARTASATAPPAGDCRPPRVPRLWPARRRSRGRYPGWLRSRSRPDPGACRPRSPSRPLLDDRVRRRHHARDLDLLPVDQGWDSRGDLVLPVVALVHEVVEALALLLVLESADPDVEALVFLADEAAEDHHSHLDLERDDLLLHALDPLVTLTRTDVVLAQLEKHSGLLELESRLGRRRPSPATTCGAHPLELESRLGRRGPNPPTTCGPHHLGSRPDPPPRAPRRYHSPP